MQLYFEECERARFGYRMARLTLDSACEPKDAQRIMEMCRSASVEMLTLRVPTNNIALVQALEALEFRSMDCLVYYECGAAKLSVSKPSTVEIRETTVKDTAAVAEIARLCFSNYFSHYHRDARLDGVKVAEAYVDWAQRCCVDRKVASSVFVPIVDHTVAGFISLRQNSRGEGEGVLSAIHPGFAGAGLFGQLINRSKEWCKENGMNKMVISTLIDNLKVQRACSNRGFHLYKSYYTFHRWFI